MEHQRFHVGDWVIYRKTKASVHPGPRAENIAAAQHGDDYTYTVDKFWIVVEVLEDGMLRLQTRRGKQHIIRPEDPNVCRASWWARLVHRRRFQAVAEAAGSP